MSETDLMRHAGRLKDIPRTGWVRKGVSAPESVADHSYRTAILAYIFAPEAGLDRERCVAIALLHDLHESLSGDIVPVTHVEGGMTEDAKRKVELESGRRMFAECGMGGSEPAKLWEEHMAHASPESRFVHDMDRLEMALTSLEYREQGRTEEDLSEFLVAARAEMLTEHGPRVLDRMVAEFGAVRD